MNNQDSWTAQSIEQVFQRLSAALSGLSSEESRSRLNKYGPTQRAKNPDCILEEGEV